MVVALVLCASAIAAGPLTSYAREYVKGLTQRSGKDQAVSVSLPSGTSSTSARSATSLSRRRLALQTAGVISVTTISSRSSPLLAVAVGCAVLTPLLTAAVIDTRVKRLPNGLLLTAAVAALGGAVVQSFLESSGQPVLRAIALGAALPAVLLLLDRLKPGLGIGDIKLTGVFGLWLGTLTAWVPVVAVLLSLILGGVEAVILLGTRRAHRHDRIAMGPTLVIGAWLTFLLACS